MDFSIFSTKVCEKNLSRTAGKIPDLSWVEILVILYQEYNIVVFMCNRRDKVRI